MRFTLDTYKNETLDTQLDLGEHDSWDAALAYARTIGDCQVGDEELVPLDDDGYAISADEMSWAHIPSSSSIYARCSA